MKKPKEPKKCKICGKKATEKFNGNDYCWLHLLITKSKCLIS